MLRTEVELKWHFLNAFFYAMETKRDADTQNLK